MECPKCGAEIDKSTIVCPNCKKVLKIICPDCKTINSKNICKKCGKVLVTKCVKCGKINLTKNKNCVKCGYSTDISGVKAESNTDKFAVLRIDFPNSDVVKAKLGSNQLYQKFKANLDVLIANYLASLNLRRQIYNNETYIVRFNKDYTLSASANSAILASIEIINIIAKLNFKLMEKKNVALKCNFTIMQRDAEQNPYDIDSKFHANMVYQNTDKDKKILDAFQLITDESFLEFYQNTYQMESLNSALVDGEMKRFFEIDVKKHINIADLNKIKISNQNAQELPSYIKNALIDQEKLSKDAMQDENSFDEDGVYDVEMIDFDEIKCLFVKTESINVLDGIVQILQQKPKGILALKTPDIYQPYTLKILETVDEMGIYSNIIPITCSDKLKYCPYGFFRELISSIFDYTISNKLLDTNDYSIFNNIDGSDLVEDLIKLNQRNMESIHDITERYFQVFAQIMQAIPNSLLYIEGFDKMDPGSMYMMEQLFGYMQNLNVSYLISYAQDFALHKKMPDLLSKEYYSEIALCATSNEDLINSDRSFYEDILTDFYFQRLIKYANGSTLFLDFGIQYLLECGVYQYTKNSIEMVNPKTIMIPSSLEKLILRRLQLLKEDEPETVKFLATIVMLGTRIDEKTVLSLNIPKWEIYGEKLAQIGYIYSFNNCIYFSNYNLLKKCIVELLTSEEFESLANHLFETYFLEYIPSSLKAHSFDLLGNGEKVIYEWEKLANISLSMGDISAYLVCSEMILDSLDKYSSIWSPEELAVYKSSLFENVSNNMSVYVPETTKVLAEKTLINLQKSQNIVSYHSLCVKMIQGSIVSGDYLYALNLMHNLLSTMDKSSIDPAAENFDLNFLLMSIVYVKILFNIGAYNECLDVGYNVLNAIDSTKLEAIEYSVISKEELVYLIQEMVGFIALVNVLSFKEDVVEFLNTTTKLLSFIPQDYSIFVQLQDFIKGHSSELLTPSDDNNSLVKMIYYFMKAYIGSNSPETYAQSVYKAKLVARHSCLYQFEIFADLLIGFAYINRKQYKKAASIIYKIIKTAKEKGLNAIIHSAWYVLSVLHIQEGKYDIAYGVLNNSQIQMEKNGNFSEYLTLLNKVNMFKILKSLNNQEQAQICLNQASFIMQKYGLNVNFNIDI
ncbi:MAG: zinc ribbon domain-containing protein [Cyanobacteria bacterium SIG26]|nr:zinc ribbon domain-containing protein [Cyanobacteria bacterium SIG26]